MILITTENCPNCAPAKAILEKNGFAFRPVVAHTDEGRALCTRLGIRSAPTLILTDETLYTGLPAIMGMIAEFAE